MSDPVVGQKLQGIQLSSTKGGTFSFPDDVEGKWSVVYFYPKDDTPGCTVQACTYRDQWQDFTDLGAQVIGVSKDGMESHENFVSKFSLNFPLLSDPDKVLAAALSVSSRDSFLIDPQGVVRKVWRGVDPRTTVDETKAAINEMKDS